VRGSWIIAVVLLASPALGEEGACTRRSLGAGLTLDQSTPIATLLGAPDEWIGRTVRVEGTVTEVCEMAGCWMELRAGEGEDALRVKVQDGVIVFPLEARGRGAIAEGEFEALEMSREKYVDWRQHVADENDLEFDPASVGEGPFRVFQVRGTGAEVCL
jgi:hypothetical protein